MDLCEIIRTRRSIRRFKPELLGRDILVDLLQAGRSAPSAANRQPLEFVIVDDKDLAEKIFELLAWAGYIRPKRNPPKDKRPVAYIVVLRNSAISPEDWCISDAAAAIENILLAAWCKGIGSCWLSSVERDQARQILNIPEKLYVDSVIALGYPDENPVMEAAVGDSIEYYLDANDRLHVPKRPLKAVTHVNKYGTTLT